MTTIVCRDRFKTTVSFKAWKHPDTMEVTNGKERKPQKKFASVPKNGLNFQPIKFEPTPAPSRCTCRPSSPPQWSSCIPPIFLETATIPYYFMLGNPLSPPQPLPTAVSLLQFLISCFALQPQLSLSAMYHGQNAVQKLKGMCGCRYIGPSQWYGSRFEERKRGAFCWGATCTIHWRGSIARIRLSRSFKKWTFSSALNLASPSCTLLVAFSVSPGLSPFPKARKNSAEPFFPC